MGQRAGLVPSRDSLRSPWVSTEAPSTRRGGASGSVARTLCTYYILEPALAFDGTRAFVSLKGSPRDTRMRSMLQRARALSSGKKETSCSFCQAHLAFRNCPEDKIIPELSDR